MLPYRRARHNKASAMTSSAKPEVHNASQRRRRSSELRSWVTYFMFYFFFLENSQFEHVIRYSQKQNWNDNNHIRKVSRQCTEHWVQFGSVVAAIWPTCGAWPLRCRRTHRRKTASKVRVTRPSYRGSHNNKRRTIIQCNKQLSSGLRAAAAQQGCD